MTRPKKDQNVLYEKIRTYVGAFRAGGVGIYGDVPGAGGGGGGEEEDGEAGEEELHCCGGVAVGGLGLRMV